MAKQKPKNEENDNKPFEEAIEKDGDIIIVKNKSHLKPMEEPTGTPPRPKAIDPSHEKPMVEPSNEVKKIKAIKPEHLKPQE